MDAFSVVLIVVLGAAALVPAVWSIVGLAQGNRGYLWGVIGLGWAVLWLAVFFVAMGAQWGGCDAAPENGVLLCDDGNCRPRQWDTTCGRSSEPDSPDACAAAVAPPLRCPAGDEPAYAYCEVIGEGAVRQPWATWSDLGFVAAGLWVLWFLGFAGGGLDTSFVPTKSQSPMRGASLLSVTYGLLVIFMGPASMLLHASMKSWAGWFDAFSVFTWMFFHAAYVVFASWGLDRTVRTVLVMVLWLALAITLGIVSGVDPGWRFYGIVISAGCWIVAVVVDGVSVAANRRVEREWWWFGGVLFLLGSSMLLWVLWNPDISGPDFCRDVSGFPGHAIFHMGAAGAALLAFIFYRSEQAPGADGNGAGKG